VSGPDWFGVILGVAIGGTALFQSGSRLAKVSAFVLAALLVGTSLTGNDAWTIAMAVVAVPYAVIVSITFVRDLIRDAHGTPNGRRRAVSRRRRRQKRAYDKRKRERQKKRSAAK